LLGVDMRSDDLVTEEYMEPQQKRRSAPEEDSGKITKTEHGG